MISIDLSNKNAIVCGASKGIGKAIALSLAECGASVVLLARDGNLLQNCKDQLSTVNNQKHQILMVDFDDPEDLKIKATNLLKDLKVHILINNTGGPPAGKAILSEPSQFENAFRQHLICNQILVQSVLDCMKEQSYGRIINIISTSVKQPLDNLGVSNTIRGAVANWAKTLANELGQFNITVNNVLPGATRTSRLEAIIEKESNMQNKSILEITSQMLNTIPMKRFALPIEIANVVAFLASPLASYINGINLPVDGGRTKSL